jgi:hypothetical protein
MTALVWDQVGERRYETGIDRGVLFLPDGSAVPWNGLTLVSENRERELKPYYLDGLKYLDRVIPESFSAKLQAFTYPDELAELIGEASFTQGVFLHDQPNKSFHLSYRTRIGNDTNGNDYGYKIHLLYDVQAVPSTVSISTLDQSIAPEMFEWTLSGVPTAMIGNRPTNHISFDSRLISPILLGTIEELIYGSSVSDPNLPILIDLLGLIEDGDWTPPPSDGDGTPDVEIELIGSNAPTFDADSHVITLPVVTGIQWQINGADVDPGEQPSLFLGDTATVFAQALTGYVVIGDDTWVFDWPNTDIQVELYGVNEPTYSTSTHAVTLPIVTGIQWQVDGVDVEPGEQPPLSVGESITVFAQPLAGYVVVSPDTWIINYL